MAFKKGQSGNPKGRKKGALNKSTAAFREILGEVIKTELDRLHETLNQVDPEKRLEFIIKVLPFLIPKLENNPEPIIGISAEQLVLTPEEIKSINEVLENEV